VLLLLAVGGCARSPFGPPACGDGIDNDGDGRVDLADPGCRDPADDSEQSEELDGGADEAAADGDGDEDGGAEEDGEAREDDGAEDDGTDGDVDGGDDGEDGDAARCTTGCWTGSECVDGTAVSACGTGGGTCRDCDDGFDCTVDACTDGGCTHAAVRDGTSCGDPDGGVCLAGGCARRWVAEAAGTGFGAAVALGPDADGDGTPDVVIGAPRDDAFAGRVRLYSGTAASSTASWTSPRGGAELGTAVAAAADIDGDTLGEWLAGAPQTTLLAGPAVGAAWIQPGSRPPLPDARVIHGDADGAAFGAAVATGPDLGGTLGRSDFAVGAPHASAGSQAGRVMLYDGPTNVLLRILEGETELESFGAAVAVGDDADEPPDGLGEVLVGAPRWSGAATQAGRAYLFSSRLGRVLWTVEGDLASIQLGHAVALGGDLDGDGVTDAVIAAPHDGPGRVHVLDARTGAPRWSGEPLAGAATGDGFGLALAVGPDATGDGRPDLAIGAPGYDSTRGRVYLVSGADGAIARTWDGERRGDQFGSAVALGPDVDGDGRAELVVGASSFDGPGGLTDAGAVYLLRSGDGVL
jgi:hypothetical protein